MEDAKLEDHRWKFEMEVEATCLEIIFISKDMQPIDHHIITLHEAKLAIIKEFTDRLLK